MTGLPGVGFELDVVTDPAIAPGTFYLIPRNAAHVMPRMFRFLEDDLFDAAPPSWPQSAVDERDRALQYLSVLLDRFADGTPGSSADRWRSERAAARRARADRFRFLAHERLALTINRPSPAHIIGGP